MTKLEDLPPELVLQILSHLPPIHYFPLKVAGNHYLTQIIRTNLPPLSAREWIDLLSNERWSLTRQYVSPLRCVKAAGIVQGRTYGVEKLIGKIKARKQVIRATPKVKVGFKIGRVEWKFRWPTVRPKELMAVDKLMAKLQMALWLAADAGSEYIVRLIMAAGVVEDFDSFRRVEYSVRNALHRAVLKGNVGCARALVEGGARCDARGREREGGLTAFHIAAGNGDVEMMRMLLEGISKKDGVGKAALDIIADDETSALSLAATKGYLAIVRLLLDAGASINPNGEWYIVMISAAGGKNAEIMELLLNHFDKELKLNLTVKPNIWRVLDAAADSGRRDVIEKILDSGFEYINPYEKGSYITPLHIAASKCHVEAVNLFLDRELYLDILTPDGLTPMQTAVYYNKLNTLRVFVDRGYPVTRPEDNRNELTLLHVLAESPFFTNSSVLNYLLESGLDIEAKAGDHQLTPMHHAFGAQLSVAVGFLRDAGGDINARGLHGQTPLMVLMAQDAVDKGKLAYILGSKPDVTLCDDYGNGPIHMAVYYGGEGFDFFYGTIETLVCQGADGSGKNNAGQAAVHIAAQRDDAVVVGLLLMYHDDAKVRDNKLMTPLHYLRIGMVVGGSLTEIKLRGAWGDMEAEDCKGRKPSDMAGLDGEKVVMPYERFTRAQWKEVKPRALYDPPKWAEFVKSLRI